MNGARARQVVGGGIGTETLCSCYTSNCQGQPHITSAKKATAGAVEPEPIFLALEFGAE